MHSKNRAAKEEQVSTGLGLERIVFFSDAVMAIAMTLLAFDLKVPEVAINLASSQLPALLLAMWPRFMSFFISFMVVGVYWTSHHRYFAYIKRYDNRLIFLNMLFLLLIACMPFVASILGQYGFLPVGIAIYAAAVALTGSAITAMWWYASHNHRLIDERLDSRFIRARSIAGFAAPVIFLASIPFAFINPLIALLIWFASPLLATITLRIHSRTSKPSRK